MSRRDVFSALADTWGLPLVDLIEQPPDDDLVREIGAEALLREQWVPHHRTTDTLWVATSERPSDALMQSIRVRFDVGTVRFAATSDWDIDQAILLACKEELMDDAAYGLADRTPERSARSGWGKWQRIALIGSVGAFVIAATLDWRATVLLSLLVVNLLFLFGIAFKVLACLVGMRQLRRVEKRNDPRHGAEPVGLVRRLPDNELPVYTILVPAYHEANVVAKVIEHVGALDYPMSKLQVLLLMEADDADTIAAAKAARPPDHVRFVVVPAGGPQTKPKACNVGLALAEGEFLVIYDAEDRPEPEQLREVVSRFLETPEDVVCLQARLNYFNARENLLTRMFTLEYSFWFDDMLPGLDAMRLPIPLGGTSNHFRVSALRELGGWDPYNVTEDADLGVRAAADGKTVGIIESTTWEEACSEWKAWIRQRTRWIKGYMVTALVHMRRPRQLYRETGARGVFGVLGLIAGTPAMFLCCPLVWGFWLFTFLGGTVPGFHLPSWVETATLVNLLVGNGAMILLSALAARRRRAYDLIPFALLNPVYWVLHSIAAYRALWQLIVSPSHWEKTPHGIVHGPHRPVTDAATGRTAELVSATATSRG